MRPTHFWRCDLCYVVPHATSLPLAYLLVSWLMCDIKRRRQQAESVHKGRVGHTLTLHAHVACWNQHWVHCWTLSLPFLSYSPPICRAEGDLPDGSHKLSPNSESSLEPHKTCGEQLFCTYITPTTYAHGPTAQSVAAESLTFPKS